MQNQQWTENWSVNSAAATFELLQDAAGHCGFPNELFPVTVPRRWDGSEATGLRISHDYVTHAFQIMRRESEEAALGIRLARHIAPRAFNNLIALFMSSSNLEVGLQQWIRFQALFTTASRIRLSYEGDRARLSVSLADGALTTTCDQAEYFLALMWRYVDWLTAGAIQTREIQLSHVSGPLSVYENFFGAPVRVGASNAIIFDRDALQAPSVHACMSAFAAAERLVEREVRAGLPDSVAARVSAALKAIGGRSIPELEDVATYLRMSRRTLQRRLTDEGESFSGLIDAHCRYLALDALAGEDLTNEAVAERCGFAETRSFYRAFSRWTGTTPKRFRPQ